MHAAHSSTGTLKPCKHAQHWTQHNESSYGRIAEGPELTQARRKRSRR